MIHSTVFKAGISASAKQTTKLDRVDWMCFPNTLAPPSGTLYPEAETAYSTGRAGSLRKLSSTVTLVGLLRINCYLSLEVGTFLEN